MQYKKFRMEDHHSPTALRLEIDGKDDKFPGEQKPLLFIIKKRAFPRSLLRDCFTKSFPKGEIP
jgi:hypothetical protein